MRDGIRTAAPREVSEIIALIRGLDGTIVFVAGGTDLIIKLKHEPPPDLMIDISQIADLAFVDMSDDDIRIGSATTFATLAEHPGLFDSLPALGQAALQVGSVQIRNRATIGGNIASAMPAGDMLPVLKCLDCRIDVLDRSGAITTREFDDVVVGAGKTSLNDGDLITSITIPRRFGDNTVCAFRKIGPRTTLSIARLILAAVADYDRSQNRIEDIRVVAGAIGPVPQRLHLVERELRGRRVDLSLGDDFLHGLIEAVDTAIPGRYSLSYKRRAVIGVGLDLLHAMFGAQVDHETSLKALA